MADNLQKYWTKRNFGITSEPKGVVTQPGKALSFVIQKHAARRLHYDFRLELGGTLKSWAVPKGPSLDPADKRMAVHVEDHPLAYATFEGVIPPGQYGAGTVIVWDRGVWIPTGDPCDGYRRGKLKFELQGEKLRGRWTLVRMRGRGNERQEPWLLIKERDETARPAAEYDITEALPDSVNANNGERTTAKPARNSSKEKAVTPEDPPVKRTAVKGKSTKNVVAATALGVKISHGERVIDASTGLTKLDLVRYYESVAEYMLPHLKGRPTSLVRGPGGIDGQLFFQKHVDTLRISGVNELDPSFLPGHPPMLEIATATALVQAAQLNVIEFHTWNATVKSIENPDRILFDLDPGEGVQWRHVVEGTMLAKAFLDELKLKCFLKTSGGKGLHIVVPLSPVANWDEVKDFSEAIVVHLARTVPQRFVAKSGPKNRVGKIFIDYLRNSRGATTAAAFSARARPGLGVSMPLAWDELEGLKSASQWNITNAHRHLVKQRLDPWQDYKRTKQTIKRAAQILSAA
jgi:bifunctional non-homologous end joining protein LigD